MTPGRIYSIKVATVNIKLFIFITLKEEFFLQRFRESISNNLEIVSSVHIPYRFKIFQCSNFFKEKNAAGFIKEAEK